MQSQLINLKKEIEKTFEVTTKITETNTIILNVVKLPLRERRGFLTE